MGTVYSIPFGCGSSRTGDSSIFLAAQVAQKEIAQQAEPVVRDHHDNVPGARQIPSVLGDAFCLQVSSLAQAARLDVKSARVRKSLHPTLI